MLLMMVNSVYPFTCDVPVVRECPRGIEISASGKSVWCENSTLVRYSL